MTRSTRGAPRDAYIMYAPRGGVGINAFETPVILNASPGYSNSDRWGDFATVSQYPADRSLWVSHEWARSTQLHDWGTWWGNVRPVTAWVATYNGPANSNDRAKAIAVDSSGNVYVAGHSTGATSNYDYVTIKYDANGNRLWTATYNGPGNNEDTATAIAVDSGGNVYVTGKSYGSGTLTDYATIKYGGNGNQLWVARYNGPANSYDSAAGLALDGVGNIYVTGESSSTTSGSDFATLKYDNNGNQTWVARYSSAGINPDAAAVIKVDSNANVYAAGLSTNSAGNQDYTTVKYDTFGNQQWAKTYDGPSHGQDVITAIALDSAANVYVTGYSVGSGDDVATIKYGPTGTQLWLKRYATAKNDHGRAIAVDAAGNVYVAGDTQALNGSTDDYITLKYNSSGTQLWVKLYNGPGPVDGNEGATALALDSVGNIYVTGYSSGTGTYATDFATVKYDTNRTQMWVERYASPSGGSDFPYQLVLDSASNIYIAGYFTSAISEDCATIKYYAH